MHFWLVFVTNKHARYDSDLCWLQVNKQDGSLIVRHTWTMFLIGIANSVFLMNTVCAFLLDMNLTGIANTSWLWKPVVVAVSFLLHQIHQKQTLVMSKHAGWVKEQSIKYVVPLQPCVRDEIPHQRGQCMIVKHLVAFEMYAMDKDLHKIKLSNSS